MTFFICFVSLNIFSQFTTDSFTYKKNVNLENSNTWAVGGGFSNFIMHGDLRSIGTGTQGNFWNFGGYLYIDKMFNPLLGLEFKVNYNKISGGAQYFSDIYDILYISNTQITDNLFFDGRAYGAEMNLILSFSNIYSNFAEKWHFSGYFGMGYHQYNSALYQRNDDGSRTLLIDFGNNPARNNVREASSIYLSAQLGIKYRINKRVDFELRPSWYFNYEDHLDATISNKQNWETFFVTHIGVAIKLGKKKTFTIWGDEAARDSIAQIEEFKIIDTDGDGVMDQLDVEPNTPKGVLVYGNGKAIDSDKDTIPDYKDECPLKYGPVENNGCPMIQDSDNDGVYDNQDLCPNTPGKKENKGCPEVNKDKSQQLVLQSINLLSANVFFDTGKDIIRKSSYPTLNRIAKLINKLPVDIKFLIEGHTDDRDRGSYNQYLSERRAANVRRYLVSKGVPLGRLSSIGYGETRPKFSNETIEGRQLNRRVEIHPINENSEDFVDSKSHVVKQGETLFSIAQRYGITIEKLQEMNDLKNDTTIIAGQVLKVKE